MPWSPTYVTVAELAAYMRIGDSGDDLELELAVEAASRAIDDRAHRQFGQVDAAEARRYTATYNSRRGLWQVEIDDLMTVTPTPVVAVTAGAITGFALEPANAAAKRRPWTKLMIDVDSTIKPTTKVDDVEVTALWGWSAIPRTIKKATMLQASRLHSRRTSPYGIAGSPEMGSELRLLAKLDPDVAVSLAPYVRMQAIVG